jgi:suppressor for copper-sensitivity B
MPLLRAFVAFLLLLGGLVCGAGPATAGASGWVGDEHAAVRLISAGEATGSAGSVDLGLDFRLAPGWHIYWRSPGDAGYPPSVDWTGSENLAAAELAWPAPRRLTLLGFETMAYDGRTVLPVTARLATPGAPLSLQAQISYLACAEICVPYDATLAFALPAGPAGPGPEAPLIAAAAAKVPGPAAAAGITVQSARIGGSADKGELSLGLAATPPLLHPDLFVEGLGDNASAAAARLVASHGDKQSLRVPIAGIDPALLAGTSLTVTLVDGARSAEFQVTPDLASGAEASATGGNAILLIALLGGLILNIMPCVLPVLALKLLSVTAHAGAERRRIRLGFLASAAGILVSFLLLAAAAIAARAGGLAVGWGMQFQQPVFLVLMIGFMLLFAASLLPGGLVIGVPGISSRLAAVEVRHPLADAFLTGVLATLLATPCSAPFVGTALGFALTGGNADILLIFLAMGLGFAAPYIVVAATPALVQLLPRPGRWMIWLETMLALLLAGTAAWLASVLAAETGWRFAATIALLALLLVVLLAWRSHSTAPATRRFAGSVAALVAVAALAAPSLVPGLVSELAPAASAASARWVPFDPAERDRLVRAGKLVLVDVTADWCLTCKLNKAVVLDRGPVQARLAGAGIVAMRADWTRPDTAISAYLASFDRFGIPFDAVYGPAAPDGVALPEILSDSSVLAALDRAAGR